MGNQRTHHTKRQALRKRLRAQGVPEPEITRIVDAKAAEQRAERRADGKKVSEPAKRRRPRDLRPSRTPDPDPTPIEPLPEFDDKAFRPAKIDDVLTGAGRATGAAAKAVRRRKTLTKYEYDQLHGTG